MKIFSPMATGNGAYIVHEQLASCIDDYVLEPYHPNYTLLPALLPLFSKKGADIIHTTPDYGVFFNKKYSKLILTFHNYVLDKFMNRYSSLPQRLHYKTDLRYFTKLSSMNADALTAVSRFTADLAKRDLELKQDIQVIYNGIDESLFVPSNRRAEKTEITLLFSGNPSRRKGFAFLPEIIPILNDNIRILFTTGLRDSKPYGVSNKLTSIGRIPYEKMPELYNEVDILIAPSVREGFGLSVVEAMSCALPVVAFNTSSIPELIDHELGGYLTEIYDAKKFANSINKLAESKKLRDEMGEYNRNKVERLFTRDRMINEYVRLFEEVSSNN